MTTATGTTGEVIAMDGQGSADLFDQIAKVHMGISGSEFIVRWDRGDFEGVNWDDVAGLTEVAMALPFARRQ
ncbi:hypothetical protein OHB26_03260 [Nocardia sp. NBC_01503]|uniref:hypothetical protein n=1 Tax=Nocardia sp. NBC_01503 TaxID=2975997 RepID=UPI002E7B9C30|nr:hypothetical protein [Nocardia sp. NBC_01503]WTL33283.1 hypothetical protein OHB26_03260 [Nocardia sp. NBC_01503]